jgi:hypothetical protein
MGVQLSLEQFRENAIYFAMKTLFLAAVLMASVAAVYADDAKAGKDAKPQQAQPSCCSAKTSTQAKPMKALTVAASTKTSECSDCCKEAKVVKQALLTPRAAAAKGL